MKKDSFYKLFNKDKKTSDKLPKYRFLAYFDIFVNRGFQLVRLSLLTSLFFLPLLAFIFIWNLYVNNVTSNTTDMSTFEINYRYFSLMSMAAIISIPLIIIGFIGLGALFNVLKKFVYQDGDIFLERDFFRGVKDNIKASLLSGIIFALVTCLFIMNLFIYPCLTDLINAFKIIMIVLLCLVYIGVIFLCLYLLSYGAVYQFSFKATMKNSLMVAFILYPQNLLFTIISGLFIILYFAIPIVLSQIITLSLLIIYGFAHLGLTFTLYSYQVFDKHINSKYESSIVKKGLDVSK